MGGHLRTADLIIVAIYLLGTILMGCYFAKKNKTPDQFMKAGGNLPGWIIGLSIFGGYVSSISFLANTGSAYSGNWSGWVYNLSLPLAAIVAIKWVIPYYRKKNVISCFEPLEERFGLWARMYASLCFIVSEICRMGVILYLVVLPVNQLTGISIPALIVVIGISVMIYTLIGGIEGVIYTDAMQAVVLVIGALICVVLIPMNTPGGFYKIISIGMAHNKFSLGSFSPDLIHTTFWVMILMGFTLNLQSLSIDQNQIQRYVSAKSEKEAKKSAWILAILYVPVGALFYFIGVALYAYYQTQPNLLPQALHAAGSGDKVFPHFIAFGLPVGMAGIVIAAIMAAAMSTMSSSLNVISTLFCEDYYKRFSSKVTEKKKMRVLRISTVVVGLVGTGVSLSLMQTTSALQLQWLLAGIFGGGILGLFILSIITYKIKNTAAVSGVVGGILIIAFLTFSQMDKIWPSFLPKYGLSDLLTPVFGTAAVIVIGFLVTFFIAKNSKRLKQ
ncbi:MAG TPA: sodium:solute symporter [Victivallales bacterium]|nr:sodium:solute symporter [Victivallales bacterium]